MITGIIKNGRATVNVIFRLENQPDFTIEFVIDTGFTEFLSLPTAAVNLLGFPCVYDMYATLADNSRVLLPVHQATIIWNGEERVVNVLATGKRPLLGTALLDGYKLSIQFIEGGLVTIEEL
jgi:clan AA aspartic protease